MSKLYNLAKMTTTTTGTGTITLGSAVSGFLTFAQAGISDGDIVSYGIVDGSNREVGTGTYTTSGTTLTRTVVNSTNSNAAISLSGSATVFITAIAANFGMTLLEQHTASASSTLDFTSFITSAHDEYVFEAINIVPATNNTSFLMRMGTGGGPTYDSGTNYGYAGWRWAHNGSAAAGANSGLTSIDLGVAGGVKSDVTLPLNGRWTLYDPQSTAAFKHIMGQIAYTDNQPIFLGGMITGGYRSTTAVTAIRFLMASGNITSGTIRVYGIAK